jgi:hypothetical protein
MGGRAFLLVDVHITLYLIVLKLLLWFRSQLISQSLQDLFNNVVAPLDACTSAQQPALYNRACIFAKIS